jgi:hypothetical protein
MVAGTAAIASVPHAAASAATFVAPAAGLAKAMAEADTVVMVTAVMGTVAVGTVAVGTVAVGTVAVVMAAVRPASRAAPGAAAVVTGN